VAGRLLVFPFGCWNNDEAVYQLQAASLATGRLFPIAPSQGAGAMTPWLTASRGDSFVPKYSPVAPAFYAVGDLLRAPLVSFAIVAALTVIAAAGLTRALGGSRAGVGAALALIAMPVFMMQSWTALSYVPSLALSLFALWAAVSASELDSSWRAAAAGLLGGLVAAGRPLDGVIIVGLVIAWLVVEASGAQRVRLVALAAGAAGVVAVAMLFYNTQSTGDVFTLPFNILDRSDSWGLGKHRLLPTETAFDFSPARMVEGAVRNAMLVLVWAPGSLVGAALAVRALRRGRLRGRWLLIAWAATTFIAYAFFWGSYNATITWGASNYLGPYYFLPVMTIVAMAAGTELSIAEWSARKPAIVAVGVLSAVVIAVALPTDLTTTRVLRAVDRATAPAREEPSFVVVDPRIGDFLNTPYGNLGNDPDLTGTTLYAIGNRDVLTAVRGLATGRQLWTLSFLDSPTATSTGIAPRLDRAQVVTGTRLKIDLPQGERGQARMQWGSCVLTRSTSAATTTFEISPEGLVLDAADHADRCPPAPNALTVSWGPDPDHPNQRRFVVITVSATDVTALVGADAVTTTATATN